MYVTVDLDTGPGTQPRSYEYNEEGMPLEGWEQVGGPFFGCTWFRKKVETREEAEELKAIWSTKCREMYANGRIRGAQVGIES